MIDSHCHIDSEQFDQDREAVIERALAAGVTTFLGIGTGDGPPDLDGALKLSERHPAFLATVGVHPHHAARVNSHTLPKLMELAQHPRCMGIGEIGLDYHYDFAPREVQQRVFINQLELARDLGLPVVIHTREAWEDTLSILREHWRPSLGGIFHCFGGTIPQAEEALALNFHFGIGGVLTFPRSEGVRETVSFLPMDRIVLETDAPYLAPLPHRGKRNEPALIVETARRLAALRGLTLEEVDELTTANFRRVFSTRLERLECR